MAVLPWACLLACALAGTVLADGEAGSVKNSWSESIIPRLTSRNEEVKTPWMEQVGLHPRVFYYHNFLTDEERRHMIRLAAPMMKRSTVVGSDGSSVVDDYRTSYGMFIMRRQDPIVERIENRIALATHMPIDHQEDIQVLRYQKGQNYKAHYDSSYDNSPINGPRYRLATFLMYLSDVEEGGETAFPEGSVWFDSSIPKKMGQVSDCAKGHVAAKPRAGDAVLFYSYHNNGTRDLAAMHAGCPVIKGIKWAAPVWVHTDRFRPEEMQGEKRYKADISEYDRVPDEHNPGLCMDLHTQCAKWAAEGECEKNKGFMAGDTMTLGTCRKACKTCEVCPRDDIDCLNRNRKRSGYLQLDPTEMEWLGVADILGEGHSAEL